jgi:hypothetical protein
VSRHPLDLVSLIAGFLFTALGVLFGLDAHGTIDIDVRWIPAIVLLALGAGGIAHNLLRTRARAAEEVATPEMQDA